jgi:hypothetical protein
MSTGYDSSIDAFRDLLSSQQITDITANLSHLTNGIEYSFVEVTCNDGVQYGLQAYGKEALELNRVALQELVKISLKKPRILPMIVSS